MKKAYMTPAMETIELKTKCAMLIPTSKTDSGTPTEWAAPGMDFDEEEDW